MRYTCKDIRFIRACAIAAVAMLMLTAASVRSFAENGFGAYEVAPGMIAGMTFVEGGCFIMGGIFNSSADNEQPAHKVCVDDYYIGKYEVTFGAFKQFAIETGYVTEAEVKGGCIQLEGHRWAGGRNVNWRQTGFAQTDMSPVVCVSYKDVQEYIKYKSAKTGIAYRLATEAEWEYASRSGGRNIRFGWGNKLDKPSANISDATAKAKFSHWPQWTDYTDGYVYTAPVGSFAPNSLGIFDMTGNVWEWVGDNYHKDYYAISPRENPKGPSTGRLKVMRGGSWFSRQACLNTTKRTPAVTNLRMVNLGFRLATSPDAHTVY